MPVEQTVVLNITCDNEDCPGTRLDPTDRTGWIFVSHEVYGQPTAQSVFCSSMCASVAAAAAEDDPDIAFPRRSGTPEPMVPVVQP